MEFIKRLQSLPESQKKVILWAVIIIVGLLFFLFWVRNIQRAVSDFRESGARERFLLPSGFEQDLKNMPRLEVPEFEPPQVSEQEWEELKEELSEEEIEQLKALLEPNEQNEKKEE